MYHDADADASYLGLPRMKRVAEMITLRTLAGGEVVESGVVLSLRGAERQLLKRRPDLASWRRSSSALMPGLTIWTPA